MEQGSPQSRPPPHLPAAPAVLLTGQGGGRKASRGPETPWTAAAGGASCYCRCRPQSRWIASARAPATCSWRSRERAPRGGGASAGAGPLSEPSAAALPTQAGPALSLACQPMVLRGPLLCKSAEASVFIEKSTKPAPPPAVGSYSILRIVCPISPLCERTREYFGQMGKLQVVFATKLSL